MEGAMKVEGKREDRGVSRVDRKVVDLYARYLGEGACRIQGIGGVCVRKLVRNREAK